MLTPAGGRRNPFCIYMKFCFGEKLSGIKIACFQNGKYLSNINQREPFLDMNFVTYYIFDPPSGKSETYSPPPGPRGPGHTIGHKVRAGCGCVHAPGRDHPPSPPPTTPWNQGHILPPMGPTPPGIPRCIKLSGWNTSILTKFVNTPSLKNCSLFRSFTGL